MRNFYKFFSACLNEPMTEKNPEFTPPPWVYGPSETMKWIEATHPSKKDGKKSHEQALHKKVRNITIHFDLNVDHTPLKPSHKISYRLRKLCRATLIEEQFDVGHLAETLLRGLAKAKFKHTEEITVDGKNLYDHPEMISDLRQTIEHVKNSIPANTTRMEMKVDHTERKTCIAFITIKKVHRKKEHSVTIQFKGELDRDLYHAFLNYLHENLGIPLDSMT